MTRLALAALLAMALPLPASAQTADAARAFLNGIYGEYIRTANGHGDPHIPPTIYTPELQRLWARTQDCPALIADPLIDAQDWMFTKVDIALAPRGPGGMRATVRFKNGPEDRKGTVVRLDLAAVQGAWKIADIVDPEGGGLRSALLAASHDCHG